MTKLETEFLEEYKRTDNLNADYKMLKHLRWLRNRIAHDTDTQDLKSSDLDDLKTFRKRFMKSQDPLSLSVKIKKSSSSKKADNTRSVRTGSTSGLTNKKPFPWARVIIGAFIAAIIYLIIRNGGSIF